MCEVVDSQKGVGDTSRSGVRRRRRGGLSAVERYLPEGKEDRADRQTLREGEREPEECCSLSEWSVFPPLHLPFFGCFDMPLSRLLAFSS